ncbi:SH3 domain-containing protein [Halobacillus litoralis]|uniref:SH3 domain-containing protein n=1 Tax=Halobacillus litoralis TaxID=45668 RepID=UPI001CFE0A61|nr:SH3 domain-containing protein [Halobacillus litoralis]
MKKGLFFMFLFMITFVITDLESKPVYADEVIIQVEDLNVRSGPGTNHSRIGQVHKGETYTISKKQGDWIKINWNGKTGWVAEWLTKVNKKETTSSSSYYSKYDYLRIRSAPGLSGSVKGYLMKNARVESQEKNGKWLLIKHGDIKGWVHGDYLAESNDGDSSEEQTDENHQGTPSEVRGEIRVNTSTLNVRSQNSTKGKILTQVRKGQVYEYIDEKDRWYQIKWGNGKTGWVAGWLVEKVDQRKPAPDQSTATYVSLSYNNTNLRSGPSTNNKIVGKGSKGDQFDVIDKEGNWYKIKYNTKEAYVAGWIVEEHTKSNQQKNKDSNSLQGRTIMIDPGHGGYDSGALGRSGSYESLLTLDTAFLVKERLERAGAEVLMTRTENTYVSLSVRSYYSNSSNADAFISLHYNSAPLSISATGINSYYYHAKDQNLALSLQSSLIASTGLRDRGIKKGNFHVIRENTKPAILLELGFLSDAREEQTVKGSTYQNQVSEGITQGLIHYFK